MKKIILWGLFLFIQLISKSIHCQWQIIKTPFEVSLNCIIQPNDNLILMGGIKGAILMSTDGAQTWDSLPTNSQESIYSLTFNETHCFALAGNDSIFSAPLVDVSIKSSWTKTKLPGQGANELYFYNNYLGFASGKARGALLKSQDAGKNWELIQTNLPAHIIHSLHFVTSEIGFALTQDFDRQSRIPNGHILQTKDGGKTWEIVHSELGFFFNDLHFNNINEAFAVGYQGMILSSSDGGKTWGKNVCQSKENLISIHFASPSVAYIIGTLGTLLQSSDNGNTWNALNVGKPYLFSGISFLNANKGYLLIDGNLILKTITGGL